MLDLMIEFGIIVLVSGIEVLLIIVPALMFTGLLELPSDYGREDYGSGIFFFIFMPIIIGVVGVVTGTLLGHFFYSLIKEGKHFTVINISLILIFNAIASGFFVASIYTFFKRSSSSEESKSSK